MSIANKSILLTPPQLQSQRAASADDINDEKALALPSKSGLSSRCLSDQEGIMATTDGNIIGGAGGMMTTLQRVSGDLLNEDAMKAQVASASRDMILSGNRRINAAESGSSLDDGSEDNDAAALNKGPMCESEVQSDTEEKEETIEINGKLYKRKTKRRVVRERQTIRQVSSVPPPALGISEAPGTPTRRMLPGPGSCGPTNPRLSMPLLSSPAGVGVGTPSPLPAATYQPLSTSKMVNLSNGAGDRADEDDGEDVTDGALVPMNDYMFQFGSFDNSEPIVSVDFLKSVLDAYEAAWITSEDLVSPNQRSRTVALAQRYSQRTSSGALIETGTFVQHTKTIRVIGGNKNLLEGLDALKIYEDYPAIQEVNEVSSPRGVLAIEGGGDQGGIDIPPEEPTSSPPESPLVMREHKEPTSPAALSTNSLLNLKFQYQGPWWSSLLGEINALPFLSINENIVDTKKEVSIRSGPIDALIVHATSPGKKSPDFYLFYESFLAMYRTFITSEELVAKLISRYAYFRSESAAEIPGAERDKLCSIVASFLVTVVSQLNSDLTPDLETRLATFRDEVASDNEQRLAQLINSTIEDQKENQREVMEQLTAIKEPTKPLPVPTPNSRKGSLHSSPSHSNKAPSILDYPAKTIAEQMTLLESEAFNRVELKDLLDIKAIEKYKVPSLDGCACHFNHVTLWTRSQILQAHTNKMTSSHREKIMLKLFEIMECFHELRNFSSYLAMLAAFINLPDSLLSKKLKSKVDRLRPYMVPPSFTEYRQEIEHAEIPCLPYLGLILQHLIHLSCGNALFQEPTSPNAGCYGPIVNYWRCWKHFLIINIFFKRDKAGKTKGRFNVKRCEPVIELLNNLKVTSTQAELDAEFGKLARELRSNSKK